MRCRRAWQTEAAPGSEPERRPRGGGCSAESTQGRGSPAARAVSEGPRQRRRDFPPLLNFPSGPRGQVLQPWELLQPCGSATLPRLRAPGAAQPGTFAGAGPGKSGYIRMV